MSAVLPNQLSLVHALQAIERGDCSADALINACYDRIEARQPEVGAWQHYLTREQYIQHYNTDKAFFEKSILKGLPVGVKDIIDTANMPTEMGSTLHSGRIPQDDATCVALIQQAGGIVLGKTVTTEFAYFKPGITANPKNLSRTPGGSSSGSAAAVADCMVPVAIGSQTAASVIRPAAYCGAVGYVGSRGEFSLRGVQPLAQSLDSLGLFARSVEDIVLLRSVLLRSVSISVFSPIKPKQIVVCSGSATGDTDADMAIMLTNVVSQLQQHGIDTPELDSCDLLKRLVANHETVMAYEAYRNLASESHNMDTLSTQFRQLLESGRSTLRETYLAALNNIANTERWLWRQFPDADAILAPAAPGVAPKGLDSTGKPHMSRPWQAMGLPVITLPGQTDADGLPLGFQLVGKARQDDSLLQIAGWLENKLVNSAC